MEPHDTFHSRTLTACTVTMTGVPLGAVTGVPRVGSGTGGSWPGVHVPVLAWSLVLVLAWSLLLVPGSRILSSDRRILARISESELGPSNPGSDLRNLDTWLEDGYSY